MEDLKNKADIILTDFAWGEGIYGKRTNPNTKFGGGAMGHYKTMTMQEVLDFKSEIDKVAADDCMLLQWVTCPSLKFGIEVMEHFGFKYKTVAMTWIKIAKNGKPRILPSYYFGCLDGETKIYILNNDIVSRINIRDLYNYDLSETKIWSPNGWKQIYGIKTNHNSKTYTVTTRSGSLKMTPEHKMFYKYNQRKVIKQSTSIRKNFARIDFDVIENIKNKWNKPKNGDGVQLLYSQSKIEKTNYLKELNGLQLNYDLGWLFGIFCAEGSFGSNINGNQMNFSLNINEVEYRERIANIVSGLKLKNERYKNQDVVAHFFFEKNKHTCRVYFSSKKIKDTLQNFVLGHSAHEKRLNLDLMYQTSIAFREGFLDGMFNGDGNTIKSNSREQQIMLLCNKELINDFAILMETLGRPCGKYEVPLREGQKGYKPNRVHYGLYELIKNYWKLDFNGDKVMPMTIKDITNNNLLTDTYDINVEDSAFVANGLVSHNSNTELLLLGIKGKNNNKFRPAQKLLGQVIMSELRQHSRKPEESYEKINLAYPTLNKVEFFSRFYRDGWTCYGDEVGKFNIKYGE